MKDNYEPQKTPLVEELSGIIQVPDNYDHKKEYSEFLTNKYNTMANFNALYPGDPGYNEAPFTAEVHTHGDPEGKFNTNSLRFTTEDDALAYAKDLFSRWTLVKEYRVGHVKKEAND